MTDKPTTTEAQLIDSMGKIIQEINERASVAGGACIVTLPSGVKCFNGLSADQCRSMGGTYLAGQSCP